MRLFTALDIPDDILANIGRLFDRLKPTARIRWSPTENMHITTKFIGEWPEIRLQEMRNTLARVPATGAIDISIRGLGWFPNPKNPRVFWAGVHAAESLSKLAAATEWATSSLGVPSETRPFSPHLTLARIRERVSLDGLHKTIAATGSDDFGSFQATAFFLYLSAGGKYTRLAEFSL